MATFWISLSEEYGDSNLDFSILVPGLLNTEMSKITEVCSRRDLDCVSQSKLALIRNPQMTKKAYPGINKLALMMSRLAPNLSTKAFSYLSKTLLEKGPLEKSNRNGIDKRVCRFSLVQCTCQGI